MTKIFSLITLLIFVACKPTDDTQSQGSDKENKVVTGERILELESINFSAGDSENPRVPTLFLSHPDKSEFASVSICSKTSAPECKEYVSVREILFLNDLEAGNYNISAKSCIDANKCSKPILLDVSVQSREKGDVELYALPKDVEKTVAEVAKELKKIAPGLALIPENACDNKLQHIPTAQIIADLSIYSLAKFLLRPEASIQTEGPDEKESLQLTSPINPYFLNAFDPKDIENLIRLQNLHKTVSSRFDSAARSLAHKITKLSYKPHITNIVEEIVENELVRIRFNSKVASLRQSIENLHETGKFLHDSREAIKSGKYSIAQTKHLNQMMSEARISYNKLLTEYNAEIAEFNKDLDGSVRTRIELSRILVTSKLANEKISSEPSQRVINAIIADAEAKALKRRLDSLPKIRRIKLTETATDFVESESNCLLATQTDILFGFYLKVLENLGEVYKNSILLTELDSDL